MNDYITYGYRTYPLKDFNMSSFVREIPNLARKYHLEIMVIDGIIYVKDTDKYLIKNPYTEKKWYINR